MTPQMAAAGLLVAVATALALPRARVAPGIRPGGGRRRGEGAPPAAASRLVPAAVGVGAGGALTVGEQGTHLVVALVGICAIVAALRLVHRAGSAKAAAGRRQSVIDLCEALVGGLHAGQPVVRAVERAVGVWPESQGVAAAAALGADVPEALRRLARLPGAAGVGRLASAWEICAATGGGLAFAAEQVLQTARAEASSDRLVQAELASARATARLVMVLPLVVLVAADGIGAHPWEFLLSTGVGAVCLAVGVALALAGLWWIDRIAVAATGEG